MKVNCHRLSCSTSQVRRSKLDERPRGHTQLYQSDLAVKNLTTNWPQAGERAGHVTFTQAFLSEGDIGGMGYALIVGGVDYRWATDTGFSRLFTVALNTFWHCHLSPGWHFGTWTSALHQPDPGVIYFITPKPEVLDSFKTTNATFTDFMRVYYYNKIWTSILVGVSGSLTILGFCGAILKYKTEGPRVLGYVSSMTRDNPYINPPPGGCTLDGLERTRLLNDMRVQIRDVALQNDVGHIALTNVRPASAKKLAFGRLYGRGLHRRSST